MGRDPSGFDWGSRRSRPATQGRVNIQYDDLSDLFGDSAYSEFFQMFFGGRPSARSGMNQRPRSGRGRDAEHPVEITLEEAFKGTQRIVLADGRRLEVKIPAGVRTGSRVRVAGEGSSSGSGGAPGDLYLVVQVQPHPIFTRDGDDLRCQVTASLFAAVLGGEIAVPTPTGRASLRIPPGTQPGQVFRLRGLGMPKLRGPSQRGNLLVQVAVRLPEHLTDEQKELFQELAGLDGP
jgi:curved DNA-binding protein